MQQAITETDGRQIDRESFKIKLKELIEEQEGIVINGDDEVLDIDSFCMMLIITFTDEVLGVTLDMETLEFDDFKSINVFVDMIFAQKFSS